MTKLVLTHTGSSVPEYTELCIRQVKFTNPDIDIDLIAEYKHGSDFVEKYNLKNVHVKAIEEIQDDFLVKRFREVSWLKAWGRPDTVYPSPDNFVQGTSERLVLLAAYLKNQNIKKSWHIENDNLIYGEFDKISPHLSKEEITCCYMNEKHTVWNVIYIPESRLLYTAMQWYVDQLAKGNEWLCKTYGLEMVHEMTVMRQYRHLKFFPSLPGETEISEYLFDPASYGQFIAGTNNGHPPGFTDKSNHDIGKAHGTLWEDIGFGGKDFPHPCLFQLPAAEGCIKLFNLHMHNKTKMKDFISYE